MRKLEKCFHTAEYFDHLRIICRFNCWLHLLIKKSVRRISSEMEDITSLSFHNRSKNRKSLLEDEETITMCKQYLIGQLATIVFTSGLSQSINGVLMSSFTKAAC